MIFFILFFKSQLCFNNPGTLLFFLEFHTPDYLEQLDLADMPALAVCTKWRHFEAAIVHSFIINHKATILPEQSFDALPRTAYKYKHITTSRIILQFTANYAG